MELAGISSVAKVDIFLVVNVVDNDFSILLSMSTLENNWHLVEKMTERLKELKPYKVILFGSYANGNPTKDSDLDVLVVLDSNDFVKSFKEKIERKMPISKILLEINYQIAMDILVYSRAEFEHLKEKNNFFIKEIETSGKVLYER